MSGESSKKYFYCLSKYSRSLGHYLRTNHTLVDYFLQYLSITSPFSCQYPLLKVFKAVAKLCLLTDFEALLVCKLIQQTKWNVDHWLIMEAEQPTDIICSPNDSAQYRRIILYALLVVYSVKAPLNEDTQDILAQITKISPRFQDIYNIWIDQHIKQFSLVSLKEFNTIFKQLQTVQKNDMNPIVDLILQMSPAYAPVKNVKEQCKTEKKHIKKQMQMDVGKGLPYKKVHTEKNQQSLTFSQARPEDIVMNVEQGTITDPFMVFNLENTGYLHQKFSSLLGVSRSNPFANHSTISLRNEQDCEQFMVGINDDSNQQFILDASMTIGSHLRRGISITEKCLTFDKSIILQCNMTKENSGVSDNL